jgi:hypothetical protein
MKNLTDYQIKNYKKQTKKELIQSLDWVQGRLNKANLKDDISGCYIIEVYKNKIPVQTISMGWNENPHGARFSEIQQLANCLMSAYQDYDSLIETKIILLEEWDELPAEQRNLLNTTTI